MPVIFGFFVAGCCVFKYLCLCVCECACVCEGVCTQVCVCWCVSYHATFASSEGQKYTAASWDKQEQIRLWAPHPWGSIAFVYQPPPPNMKVWNFKKRYFKPLLGSHKQIRQGGGGKKIRLPKLSCALNQPPLNLTFQIFFPFPCFTKPMHEG